MNSGTPCVPTPSTEHTVRESGRRHKAAETPPPTMSGDAAPLRRLVGALGQEAAAAARERSEAWRESVNQRLRADE